MLERAPHFRFRIAAPFSLRPEGRRFLLESDTLDAELAKRVGSVEVSLPRLGAKAPTTASVRFDRVSRWTIRGVVERVELLSQLAALAADQDAGSDAWVARVEEVVGEGALVENLRAIAAEASPSGSPTKPRTEAGAAIDAFLRMSGATSGPTVPAPAKRARAREALEAAVDEAAQHALSAPALVALEASYRGARWLLEARRDAPIQIELVDTARLDDLFAPSHPAEVDDFEAPDLFFASDACGVESLATACARASEAKTPLVAHGPSGPAVADLQASLTGEKAKAWNELRASDDAHFLCAVRNEVALCVEGTGASARTVFGSPVWGIAVLLLSSYRESSSFTRVLGQNGQQKAPASHLPPGSGADEWALPTREHASLRLQAEAANVGVTLLGSARRGDAILLAEFPTASSSRDARSLPTQTWVGRIVRFARWALASLPHATPDAEVDALLGQLAKVVLFPGMDAGTRLRARVVPGEKGAGDVRVDASAEPPVVGVPIEIAFTLPWRPAA
ncbi:MAG: hypothetical protein U0230_03395 [Polyangiales bacterium]